MTIRYEDDRAAAERILIAAAQRHAVDPSAISAESVERLERRFGLQRLDFAPRVFLHLARDGLELTLRFMARDHGTRAIKDLIARDVLDDFERTGLTIAPVAYRIVEMPGSAGKERDPTA